MRRIGKTAGQDKLGQSKEVVYIFSLFGENSPLYRWKSKFALLPTYAKFQGEISGSRFYSGGRISHFLIDFCVGLTIVVLHVMERFITR